MENKELNIDLMSLIKVIWMKKITVVKWSAIGMIVGIVVAISIPKEYTANIKLVPEANTTAPDGSMGALAGMIGVNLGKTQNETMNEVLYPEIFKSTPFLLEFATIKVPFEKNIITLEQYLLEKQKKSWWTYIMAAPANLIGWATNFGNEVDTTSFENSQHLQEAFVAIMASKIIVVSDKKTQVIDITAKMQSPQISYIVTDSLFAKLGRYVAQYKTQKARQNLEMNSMMLTQAKIEYENADSAFSHALDRNMNITSKVAQSKLDKLRNESLLRYNVYQQLAAQVMIDEVKLNQDTPIAVVLDPAKMPLRPSAPNMKLIIVVMTLLGAVAKIGIVIVKELNQ